MKEKFAYLIICHKNIDQVKKLLQLLDDPENDLYIHWDKKKHIDSLELQQVLKYSKLYFIQKVKVHWAGYSMVQCELELLKEAVKNGPYLYYHLISGQDLPIKRQEQIKQFFKDNRQYNFVEICEDEEWTRKMINRRMTYYYFFSIDNKIGANLQSKWLSVQRKLNIKMRKIDKSRYKYGSQWFSIHDDLARYILASKKTIKKNFQYSYCPDELFLQTLVFFSKYKFTLYCGGKNEGIPLKSIKRYIDWERGQPYIFRKENLEELIQSELLFARKFDETVDKEIVDLIVDTVG